MATTPVQTYRCWDCDKFQPLNAGVDNTGECRANPVQAFISSTDTIVSAWPPLADGTDTWCARFSKANHDVPASS